MRLYQGRYEQETVYGDDPIAVARRFVADGAPRLHVVDLDGARTGRPVHAELIRRLAASVPVPVQVGGGIRDATTARSYLEAGVAAVIFGTAAVRRPEELAAVASTHPGRVLASLDLKGGRLVLEGWTETVAGEEPEGILRRLAEAGVSELIVTDTERDGTLAGADPERFLPFLAAGFRVIAAGGIRNLDDIRRLREAGLAGVIAGRALYEGTLDLREALAAARGEA